MKKFLAILLAVMLAMSVALCASAEEEWKPTGTMRIILGFSAGGGIDIMCRTAAPLLGEYLGVDVIVENMPGASSGIATDYVLDQPADGMTILGTSSSMAAFSTTENSDNGYLQLNALAMPFVVRNVGVVVNANLGIDTIEEFIAYIQNNKTTASTAGVGSMWHLPAAQLAACLGCQDNVTFVPYDSGNKTALAVAQGECDWAAIDAMNAGEYMRQGLCKMLAVFSTNQAYEDPEFGAIPSICDYVPEMAETADIIGGWRGFMVSNETPDYIQAKLTEAFQYVCSTEEFTNLLLSNNMDLNDVCYGDEAQALFEMSCRVSSYLLYDLGDGTRNPADVGVLRWGEEK